MANLELMQGVQGLGCNIQCQSAMLVLAHIVPWLVLCPVLLPVPGVQCPHPLPMRNAQDRAAPGATGSIVPGRCTCRATPVLAASCLVQSSTRHNTWHSVPATWHWAPLVPFSAPSARCLVCDAAEQSPLSSTRCVAHGAQCAVLGT